MDRCEICGAQFPTYGPMIVLDADSDICEECASILALDLTISLSWELNNIRSRTDV